MGENNFRVCEEVQHNRVFVAEGRRVPGGKRAKLWGPRAHFGANISMKIVGEFSLICCTSMAHAGNTKIWAKIVSAYAKKCSITGFSSLRGGGRTKTQVYMHSRGMNA